MSVVRWSDTEDLYVYASERGWCVHCVDGEMVNGVCLDNAWEFICEKKHDGMRTTVTLQDMQDEVCNG